MSRRPRDARELVAHAIAALLMHRLRASLSALGIVLGIATVIAALAIGEGARRQALDEIGALGVDNVFLRSTAGAPPARSRQRPDAPVLSLRDMSLIAATLDRVSGVAGARVARTGPAGPFAREEASFAGVSAAWAGIMNLTVARGRWLSDDDAAARRRVGVIGAGLARALFGGSDPLGARVRVASSWFVVVGVLAPVDARGRSAVAGAVDADRSLLVPLPSMDLSLGAGDRLDRLHEIAIRVDAASEVEAASLAIEALAARAHRDGGYEIIVPRQLLAARLRARRTFDVVLGAVGCIALLISGVGIMNIMLASVAERTHEIGVRRAVGARRSDVVAQFTAEASILCLAGAGAGVPLGVIMAVSVAALGGWPIGVSWWSVVLAIALAGATGLAFGLYPARVAGGVSPVEALRAE